MQFAGSAQYSSDEFSVPNMINNCSLCFLCSYSNIYVSTYETLAQTNKTMKHLLSVSRVSLTMIIVTNYP